MIVVPHCRGFQQAPTIYVYRKIWEIMNTLAYYTFPYTKWGLRGVLSAQTY